MAQAKSNSPMRIPESLRAMGTEGFKISSLKVKHTNKSQQKQIKKHKNSSQNRAELESLGPVSPPDFDDVELVEPFAVDLRVERRRHPETTMQTQLVTAKSARAWPSLWVDARIRHRTKRIARNRKGNERD